MITDSNREVSLNTHYETKQNHIPVDAFDKFVSDHQEMMNNLSYSLTYNKNLVSDKNGISWLGIIISILSLGFGIWLVLRLYYYYDPQPMFPASGSQPIGGWLILIAIGLFMTPFRIANDLFHMPEVYQSQTWSNLLVLKRYALFAFIFFEQIYNMVNLAFSVLILVLFFQRRSSLPRLITFYFGITCFVTILDTLVVAQIDSALASDYSHYREMISSIVAAAIWIPYFNISSRVKETFVKSAGNDDDDNIFVPEVVAGEYHSALVNEQKY